MRWQTFVKSVESKYVTHKWLKPQAALEDRLYQRRILGTAKSKSTLVVLPTALGKTVIALLLALEKVEHGKVFFLAPTRPLVEQHRRTFLDKTLIEDRRLVLITGRVPQRKRAELYKNGKVIFATPQCVLNDLVSGVLSLSDVSLMVFDEAHRARGNYAYVGIARRYASSCQRPLVLGLTASPGGSEEKIAEVCRNLGIEAIEHRTEEDDDVKPYVQPIEVEWKRVKLPEVYVQVRGKLKEMVIERVKAIQSLGALVNKQPALVTGRDLVKLNDELQRRLERGEGGYLYELKIQTTAALSLTHMVELIETQGSEVLGAFIENSLKRMAEEGSRAHRSILNDPLFAYVRQHLASCIYVENPKVRELIKTLKQLLEANPNSRVIVFTQYRDTVKVLLKKLSESINAKIARFVGQGFRECDPGMTQEQQQDVLRMLRRGEVNVLIATSIAEEGLDIPEVDHVIFYEPVPSEIRYVQRRGRTGRKVAGKVTILVAEDTLDEAFYWSSVMKAKRMKKIIKELNRKLPQMLKREAKPTLVTPSILKPGEKLTAYMSRRRRNAEGSLVL